ncbi:class I SAM-dependent methyltransferase [Nitrosopumilus ureiphilus]|nr:class I SAM-dependent methyltransferase [Nitrosopumilus ureiphilus]
MEENTEKKWWELIRNGELATALEMFPKKKNLEVLEIGGRDGFQAELISKNGYNVTSIDIKPLFPQFFPVQKGDINKLNFKENSFDIIFSSNMLQEIVSIKEAFNEMKRVLKKDGVIIHIVPSSWWSLITNFWHYCLIPKYLIKSKKFQSIFNSDIKMENTNKNISKEKEVNSAEKNLKRLFFHPLGANTSFIHEIIYFSNFYWKELFRHNGFEIICKKNCPFFYSGYAVFKFKFLNFRKLFAKYFPSCYCFVLTQNSSL